MKALLFIFCMLCAIFVGVTQSSIISQSSITRCEWGDESEPSSKEGQPCEKKLLVSVTLKGGQGETESIYANIDQAYQEGDSELSRLKKPFRMEMRKSEVIASYRAYYQGSANARPLEIAIKKRTCRDGWYEPVERLPCRKQIDVHGEDVWDSQGFCCRCDDINKRHNVRGNFSCDLLGFIKRYGSAHCMQMNDLWYDIFELDQPMLQYNITLTLMEFNGIMEAVQGGSKYANWTTVSTFYLNPSRTSSRSKDGRVVAEIQGDLMGSRGIVDFSYKYLLVPSILRWSNESLPVQYTNGPGDWLLVDQHQVELGGTECNKIGVDYTGFRRQQGKCNSRQQSCFTNQPLDYWEHDNELRSQGKIGNYMAENFGRVHRSSHPNNRSFILRFVHEDLHNTFVTFRMDASNIYFVYSVGSGRIVDTHATDFEALTGIGEITAEIENTGEVTAEFSVSVIKCNRNIQRVPAKTVGIDPGQTVNVIFKLMSYNSRGGGGGRTVCEVQLFDSQFTLLQTAKVDFKVNSTCFCYGACGCTCESENGKVVCPKPPPIVIEAGPIITRVILLLLESIGAEGFIGFFGGLLLILGFLKLSFGGIICCRKTKAQEFADRMKEKGAMEKNPLLVRCSGECRGATAALARYKRKVEKLRKMGKSPQRLDDWRNSSYVCSCNSELADIRYVHIIKAVCFFYYFLFLPFIWLGKKVYWSMLRDTAAKKERAERGVLHAARKKGNLEKYGIVDLATELKKFEEEVEGGKVSKGAMVKHEAVDIAVDSLLTKKKERFMDTQNEMIGMGKQKKSRGKGQGKGPKYKDLPYERESGRLSMVDPMVDRGSRRVRTGRTKEQKYKSRKYKSRKSGGGKSGRRRKGGSKGEKTKIRRSSKGSKSGKSSGSEKSSKSRNSYSASDHSQQESSGHSEHSNHEEDQRESGEHSAHSPATEQSSSEHSENQDEKEHSDTHASGEGEGSHTGSHDGSEHTGSHDGSEHTGSHDGSEHTGSHDGSEHTGSHDGSEHTGSHDGSEHTGSHDGSEHTGSHDGSEHTGSHDGSEHTGSHDGSEHTGSHDGSEHTGSHDGSEHTGSHDGSGSDHESHDSGSEAEHDEDHSEDESTHSEDEDRSDASDEGTDGSEGSDQSEGDSDSGEDRHDESGGEDSHSDGGSEESNSSGGGSSEESESEGSGSGSGES